MDLFPFLSTVWIYGINIGLHVISALIAFLVSFYGNKAYNLTNERKYKFFSLAFLLLGMAQIGRAIADTVLYQSLSAFPSYYTPKIDLFFLSHMAAIVLFLLGYLGFVIVYFDIKDKLLMFLMAALTFFAAVYGYSYLVKFDIIAVMLLSILFCFGYKNYLKKKSTNSMLVLAAFGLLLVSHILYMLLELNVRFYSIGNVLQLAAYSALLLMLSRIK